MPSDLQPPFPDHVSHPVDDVNIIEILGLENIKGRLVHYVKLEGGLRTLIPSTLTNVLVPRLVIEFYQQNMFLCDIRSRKCRPVNIKRTQHARKSTKRVEYPSPPKSRRLITDPENAPAALSPVESPKGLMKANLKSSNPSPSKKLDEKSIMGTQPKSTLHSRENLISFTQFSEPSNLKMGSTSLQSTDSKSNLKLPTCSTPKSSFKSPIKAPNKSDDSRPKPRSVSFQSPIATARSLSTTESTPQLQPQTSSTPKLTSQSPSADPSQTPKQTNSTPKLPFQLPSKSLKPPSPIASLTPSQSGGTSESSIKSPSESLQQTSDDLPTPKPHPVAVVSESINLSEESSDED